LRPEYTCYAQFAWVCNSTSSVSLFTYISRFLFYGCLLVIFILSVDVWTLILTARIYSFTFKEKYTHLLLSSFVEDLQKKWSEMMMEMVEKEEDDAMVRWAVNTSLWRPTDQEFHSCLALLPPPEWPSVQRFAPSQTLLIMKHLLNFLDDFFATILLSQLLTYPL